MIKSTVIALVCMASIAAHAYASDPRQINVPPGDLGAALRTLAKQAGVEFFYRSDEVKGLRTAGVTGVLSPQDAVTKLLAGTSLSLKTDSSGAMLIVPASAAADSSDKPGSASKPTADAGPATTDDKEGKKSFSERFRLAQVDQGTSANSASVDRSTNSVGSKDSEPALEEVVVTANKRAERLQDVPSSITVLGGSQLENSGAQSLIDLDASVPGLAVTSSGAPGYTHITLRGIATGGVFNGTSGLGPLVGTYIGEVPIGASTSAIRADSYTPDLMPYDLDRIEVLSGPQGTLYGASAMGGLLKYVLKDPDLQNFDARVGAVVDYIDHSGQVGGGGRGTLNLPLINGVFGIRLSGYDQKTQGYIDNVGLNISHYNPYTQSGGRLAALWRVNDQLSIKFSAIFQNINATGIAGVTVNPQTLQPIYGNFSKFNSVIEGNSNKLQVYSLVADWNLGFATLTSASGWQTSHGVNAQDLTPIWRPLVAGATGGAYPNSNVLFDEDQDLRKFTEELRLTSPSGQRFEWMAGAFFTQEDTNNNQPVFAYTPTGELVPGVNPFFNTNGNPSAYQEFAVFSNGTLHFNDQLALTAGLRYAENHQHSYDYGFGGIYGPGFPTTPSPINYIKSSQGVVTWMVSPEWHLNQDSMLYAKVATGYRPGSATGVAGPGAPSSYIADTLTSYEIGIKNTLLDSRLTLNFDIYDIEWNNIVVDVIAPSGLVYLGNGKTARSRGSEASLSYSVTDGVNLGATLGYTDAFLTAAAPGIGGLDGSRLPYSSKVNGALTLDFHRPITANTVFKAGGSIRFASDAWSQVASTPEAVETSQPHPLDLYAGVQYERADIRLYVRNVFNSEPSVKAVQTPGMFPPNWLVYVPIQPRTVGLSVDMRF